MLITGGSQGSRTLKSSRRGKLAALEERSSSSDCIRPAPRRTKKSPAVSRLRRRRRDCCFPDGHAGAFAAADLVVSRAGMGAVSELAAAGKPSILVPLPTAGGPASVAQCPGIRSGRARAAGAGQRDDRTTSGGRSGSAVSSQDSQEMGNAARAPREARRGGARGGDSRNPFGARAI